MASNPHYLGRGGKVMVMGESNNLATMKSHGSTNKKATNISICYIVETWDRLG